MPQDIKLFRSKYNDPHRFYWPMVEEVLAKFGHRVNQEVEPCDMAIILGGFQENPNSFTSPYVFYLSEYPPEDLDGVVSMNTLANYAKHLWATVLKEYHGDRMYDMVGLTPKEAAMRIKGFIESHATN